MPKKTIHDFVKMKNNGEPIAFITAYDYPTAVFAERAGMDMLLVGDSLGMAVYGYENTLPVTMDQMIRHTDAVRRGAPNTFVIGDMPFMSYQISIESAVENAGLFMQRTNCDAVKLEGGKRVAKQNQGGGERRQNDLEGTGRVEKQGGESEETLAGYRPGFQVV